MRNLVKIIAVLTVLTVVLAGCQNTEPTATPTPTPTPEAVQTPAPQGQEYTFDSVIEVDSPIVGQWVPVGMTDPYGSGYMQFTADGKLIQFLLGQNGEMKYTEVRYYLSSENTFRMIRSDNTMSFDLRFEVINDGKTLNVYNTPGLNIASEFARID